MMNNIINLFVIRYYRKLFSNGFNLMRAIAMATLQGIGFCFNKYCVTNSPLSLALCFSIAFQKESFDMYQASIYESSTIKKRGAEKKGKSRIGESSRRRRQSRNQFALFV